MQEVCDLINAGEHRHALVRLWHLARQVVQGGGTRLDAWYKLSCSDDDTKRIAKYFADGQPALERSWLDTRPTDVITALDERIAQNRTKVPHLRPITVDAVDYFLVSRHRRDSVEQTQPVRFANYMRHHHIFPRQLAPGVGAQVSELAQEFPGLHAQMRAIAQRDPGELTLGLGLFPGIGAFDWDETEVAKGRRTGFARGRAGEAALLDEAKAQIRQAEAEAVDILIFPELTLPDGVLNALRGWLLQRRQEGNPCKIALLVLGSFHRRCANTDRNRTPLVSGEDGSLVAIHDKFSPATVDIRAASGNYKLTERFTAGQFALLLCTPVGNVSLAICKDCFDTYRGIWLDQLCPEWLLMPSLSDSVKDHLAVTRDLWNRHRCVSAVANQPIFSERMNVPASVESPHFGYVHAESSALEASHFHTKDPALWIRTVKLPGA